MKIGIVTGLLYSLPLKEALAYFKKLGIEMVELGGGGYPGTGHCDPKILLNDDKALDEFKKTIADSGLSISALSCHGNPVHPNKEIAKQFHEDFERTILLAEKLGITQINTFSGCPGDCEESKYPNWVTCPWPGDFLEILEYQWNEVLIPYWKKAVAFAKSHGVNKIALEMHPGFCVYNVDSLLRLRNAVGPEIGANFDPSHLVWQGVDPCVAIKKLGEEKAIFHFHAKDTKVDKYNTALNGVLDTKHYCDEVHRSWLFRTVGYGNDYAFWKDIISTLKMIGYDYVISIEHEDSLMSVNEGLTKAVSFLQEVMFKENSEGMWWA